MLTKFMVIILALGAADLIIGAKAACSSAQIGSTKADQQEGILSFAVPQFSLAWIVVMTYDKPVTSLTTSSGVSLGCDKNVCSFRCIVLSNCLQSTGSVMNLDYQIKFSTSTTAPELTLVTFNGLNICSSTQTTTTTTTTTAATTTRPAPATGRCADYNNLISYSLLFYEAQRSGKLPLSTMRIRWRKDSTLKDGFKNGVNLTGGYFDGGDYIKFGFPMAFSMTMLSWGGILFPEGYANAEMKPYLLDAIKWGTDYLMKAHVSANELYAQVGDANKEHDTYWGRPEDMTFDRPAWKITKDNPGPDLAAETAAALAAASILFRSVNSTYSNDLLNHSRQLFSFANTTGNVVYQISVPAAKGFYESSGVNDELVWSALWLFKATNEDVYLKTASSKYSAVEKNTDVLSWDSKHAGAQVLMASITNKTADVINLCQSYIDRKRTAGGLAWFGQEWGSNRYAANAAFICLAVAELPNIPSDKVSSFKEFAKGQIEYMLGNNKVNQSFVVGFGPKWPVRPHHESSSCPDLPYKCTWDHCGSGWPNQHLLLGALVGGPTDINDTYQDICNGTWGFKWNEVTTDYNAGFQSALAGLSKGCK